MSQQFAKLEKKVPEIFTMLDTSFLKDVFVQARNQQEDFKKQSSSIRREESQDLDYSEKGDFLAEEKFDPNKVSSGQEMKVAQKTGQNPEPQNLEELNKNSNRTDHDSAFFERFKSCKIKIWPVEKI